MRLLLERIADWDAPPHHVVLKTELRIRESVAPPPAAKSRKKTRATPDVQEIVEQNRKKGL
jgi:hypothetical protein